MVGHGQEAFATGSVVGAGFQKVEKAREAVDFGFVQAVEKGASDGGRD